MDIRKARKIAENVLLSSDEDRHNAFHRLDRSAMDGNKEDLKFAKKIWNYYGNKDRNAS